MFEEFSQQAARDEMLALIADRGIASRRVIEALARAVSKRLRSADIELQALEAR